jgi:hypothetical protein
MENKQQEHYKGRSMANRMSHYKLNVDKFIDQFLGDSEINQPLIMEMKLKIPPSVKQQTTRLGGGGILPSPASFT